MSQLGRREQIDPGSSASTTRLLEKKTKYARLWRTSVSWTRGLLITKTNTNGLPASSQTVELSVCGGAVVICGSIQVVV